MSEANIQKYNPINGYKEEINPEEMNEEMNAEMNASTVSSEGDEQSEFKNVKLTENNAGNFTEEERERRTSEVTGVSNNNNNNLNESRLSPEELKKKVDKEGAGEGFLGGRRRRRESRRNRRNTRNRRNNRRNTRNRRNLRGGGDPSSLPQGQEFQALTRNLHGGRRMRGGAAPFPFDDSTLLQGSARSDAGVAQQDQFYRESQTSIPASMRYAQSGGGLLSPASLSSPDMLLPRGLSEQAMNPQWHLESRTNPEIGRMAEAEANFRSTNTTPGFNGPTNAYQTQAGGRRRRRSPSRREGGQRLDSRLRRESRRNSRKNRKASRKNRKASRKNRRN